MKQIDVKVDYLRQSGELTNEEVQAAVDANLATEKRGNWAAEVIRDAYGKIVEIKVNLPDNVTDNEHSNAVAAINANNGVSKASPYPLALVEQDMELLDIGETDLPDLLLTTSYNIEHATGVTTDAAKSGTKSFGSAFGVDGGVARYGQVAYQYPIPAGVNKIRTELWIKVPTAYDTSAGVITIGQMAGRGQSAAYFTIQAKDVPQTVYEFMAFRGNMGDANFQKMDIDPTKWYKLIIEHVGSTFIRQEIQDETGNVLLNNSGILLYPADPLNVNIDIQQTIVLTDSNPATTEFVAYLDDIVITQISE